MVHEGEPTGAALDIIKMGIKMGGPSSVSTLNATKFKTQIVGLGSSIRESGASSTSVYLFADCAQAVTDEKVENKSP